MDQRSQAALRTAVSIVPGTPVIGIGLGSGEFATAMVQLSIDYAFCETELARVEELIERFELEKEAFPKQIPIDKGVIDCIDGQFEWAFILETDSPAGMQKMTVSLAVEIVRVLKPGGWIWFAYNRDGDFTARSTVFHDIGCVDASPVTHAVADEFCYRIVRKVNADTPR